MKKTAFGQHLTSNGNVENEPLMAAQYTIYNIYTYIYIDPMSIN